MGYECSGKERQFAAGPTAMPEEPFLMCIQYTKAWNLSRKNMALLNIETGPGRR
jgi:hypothetical protein